MCLSHYVVSATGFGQVGTRQRRAPPDPGRPSRRAARRRRPASALSRRCHEVSCPEHDCHTHDFGRQHHVHLPLTHAQEDRRQRDGRSSHHACPRKGKLPSRQSERRRAQPGPAGARPATSRGALYAPVRGRPPGPWGRPRPGARAEGSTVAAAEPTAGFRRPVPRRQVQRDPHVVVSSPGAGHSVPPCALREPALARGQDQRHRSQHHPRRSALAGRPAAGALRSPPRTGSGWRWAR